MREAENYNAITSGPLFRPDGHLRICPRCGRLGVERETDEGTLCVHTERLEMLPDGLLPVPVDACALAPLPCEASDSDIV